MKKENDGYRKIRDSPRAAHTHTRTYPHRYTRARSRVHILPRYRSRRRCTCPRLPRVTRRDQRKAERPGQAAMYVTSGFWITFISPCLLVPGEPRGPMRQYVPIIFRLILFHSLARSAKAVLHPSSADPTVISPKSSVWPRTHARIFTRSRVCVREGPRGTRVCTSSLGQLLVNSNLRFTMVTAQPVVDLLAITPAGHLISERCLGHDSGILIWRFRDIPTMWRRGESKKETRQ